MRNLFTVNKILPSCLLAILCAGISMSSCSDDFLDKNPIIGTAETNFYQTADDAIAAVNAAYAALQFEMSEAGHFRWFWGDIMSDDSDKGGSGDNDSNDLLRLENFEGPVNTDFLEAEWSADYEGIYRANVVLERVPDIAMDEELKARILAEAKFIRAWFNYNLVTVFGNIPLVDHVLAPSEYTMVQSDPADVWELIESDLLTAKNDLWNKSQYPIAERGRATKGAAAALLMKAYLYQENFQDAYDLGKEIIESGEYFLVSDFASIFTSAGENGGGSIFEIQYMNASGGNWGDNNANEGSFTQVFQRARGAFEGFGFNIPTEDLVQAFIDGDQEDPRLSTTVFRVGDVMGDRGVFTKDAAGGQPHDYYAKKYFSNKSEDAPFGDPAPNGGFNDRVIRYADVLLMTAEAAYHVGSEGEARDLVNEVRERARGGQSSLVPDITSSGADLLNDIYKERRLELALEGHRFFDLVRTNRAADVLAEKGYTHSVHAVFPIPLSQIQASNGAVSQTQDTNEIFIRDSTSAIVYTCV